MRPVDVGLHRDTLHGLDLRIHPRRPRTWYLVLGTWYLVLRTEYCRLLRSLTMEVKQRLREHINFVRDMSEKFLAAFQTPEQWVHQVAPGVNHALWFAGHMGTTDSSFA